MAKYLKGMFVIAGACLCVASSSSALVAGKLKERDYQRMYCRGVMEYRLVDKTRVDCLTDTHAIEYDFAKKWAEAIGQSLFYGAMTNRTPGIALIVGAGEWRYVERLMKAIDDHSLNIDVNIIERLD